MTVRPLDENGDMLPIYNQDQMISGAEAVAQVINLRMNMYYGEWWEDKTLGFRIPEFLANNLRKGDIDLVSKYIASYVSNTAGVSAVSGVSATYHNHKMTFYCTALMDNGETTTVEVDVNGIL